MVAGLRALGAPFPSALCHGDIGCSFTFSDTMVKNGEIVGVCDLNGLVRVLISDSFPCPGCLGS